MNIYFKPSVDVLHPETNSLLVSIGTNYPMAELTRICTEYGIDNIPGSLLFVEDGSVK